MYFKCRHVRIVVSNNIDDCTALSTTVVSATSKGRSYQEPKVQRKFTFLHLKSFRNSLHLHLLAG